MSIQFQKTYEVKCGGRPIVTLDWDSVAKAWVDGQGTVLKRNRKRFFLDVGDGKPETPCVWQGDVIKCGEIAIDSGGTVEERTRGPSIQRGQASRRRRSSRKTKGVGTCLSELISGFLNIKKEGGCGCARLASDMDRWGPEGCNTPESREKIITALLGNVEMLAKAIEGSDIPGCKLMAKATGSAIAKPVLKIGANWFLDRAIADARKHIDDMNRIKMRQPWTKPHTTPDPLPFEGTPNLTLISHLWPKPGWEWHLEKLEPILPRFDRVIVGIAVGHGSESFDVAAAKLPGVECVEFENKPKLRETVSIPFLMDRVRSVGIDDVTFCHHFKGVQDHNMNAETIRWWTEAMYDTVLGNVDEVLQRMAEGAWVAGSFRRGGKMLGTRHRWHYSGSFYAVRNFRVFSRGLPSFKSYWWGTESWPGDHFPPEYAACMFADRCGDMYHRDQQPRGELEQWRAARATADDA